MRVTKNNAGFTLVELAIVLVIIGLILGMAFKGKDLIDGAKVKSMAAQYNKIIAAQNIFYERYGAYPGDGCLSATPVGPAACTGAKDGLIQNGNEAAAYWYLLNNVTNIIPAVERRSLFGQNWNMWNGVPNGAAGSYLDLPGVPQMDVRYMCALDAMIDDGVWNTGVVMTNGAGTGAATAGQYDASPTAAAGTDCWAMGGQADGWLRTLP